MEKKKEFYNMTDKKKIEYLQSNLLSSNLEKSKLKTRLDYLEEHQSETKAKELIKSFLIIAERKGEDTHWDGIIIQCKKILGV